MQILHPHALPHENWQDLILLGGALGISSLAGILGLFSPGGLGVRESLATYFFMELGMSTEVAFQLAFGARMIQWLSEISLAVPAAIFMFFKKADPKSSDTDSTPIL